MKGLLKTSGMLVGVTTAAFAWSSFAAVPEDTSALTATINVTLEPVITLSVDDDMLPLSITPTSSGVFNSESTNVRVNTNSETGYTLTVATNATDSALNSDDAGVTSKIVGLTSPVSEAQFENNAWGFLGSDGLYHAVPASNDIAKVLKKTTEFSGQESVSELKIGAKVNSQITSGIYTNTIVLSAVSNV